MAKFLAHAACTLIGGTWVDQNWDTGVGPACQDWFSYSWLTAGSGTTGSNNPGDYGSSIYGIPSGYFSPAGGDPGSGPTGAGGGDSGGIQGNDGSYFITSIAGDGSVWVNVWAVPDQSGCPTAGLTATKGGFSTNTFNPHDCDGVAHWQHYKLPEADQQAAKEQILEDLIVNKPFAFFDVDCATLKKWLSVAKFKPDQSVMDKLNADARTILASSVVGLPLNGVVSKNIAYIQKINDAYSTAVNMDYFPVTVTQLPIVNGQRLGPGQFLNYIRTHINDFTDHSKTFAPYNYGGVDDRNLWNSTAPKGAIVAIDLPGPDDASVITSYSSTDRWTFTTIHEPMYGDHPVSGNRDFGYTANSDGSYTFYTRGVDRLTSWDGDFMQEYTGIPFDKADALWTSFQNGISSFVKNNGGAAAINNHEILRPDWDIVRAVLAGTKPLSTLSKDCPDF